MYEGTVQYVSTSTDMSERTQGHVRGRKGGREEGRKKEKRINTEVNLCTVVNQSR